MDLKQFEELQKTKRIPDTIKGSDLKNQSDRTLLWGYTCERESWHVYLENGVIYIAVYAPDFLRHAWEESQVNSNTGYLPDKRLYPEACDFEFCALLKAHGESLCFTTWNEQREPAQWHGKRLKGPWYLGHCDKRKS